MNPSRLARTLDALARDGASPATLERVRKRYRRPSVSMKPINRERPAIRKARSLVAAALLTAFRKHTGEVARQITKARAHFGKAIAALDLAKLSADEEAELAAKKAIVDEILAALDLSFLETATPEIEAVLLAVVADGFNLGRSQIGVSVEQVSADALAWARERAAELVGMRYNLAGDLVPNPSARYAITETTREMLRADVVRAIEDGTSTADLADALEESYAFSSDRSETIARTEVARADVEGNLESYRTSGVVEGKEWILGSEHDDDDECDEAAALGVVPLDDDFGGVGDPPAHPRCVCDVLPVLYESEDESAT